MNALDARRPYPSWKLGAGCALLSLVSIVLALGAPGLGWALASVTMVAAGLCVRLVGRTWLAICLALTTIHALALGPLAGGAGSSFGSDPWVGVVFAALPFIAGIGALVAAYSSPPK